MSEANRTKEKRVSLPSVEDAGKILSALRLAHGWLHPDDPSALQQKYRIEVGEAVAIQESFLASLQKARKR